MGLVVISTDPTYGKMPENTWSALVGMLESSDGCPEDVGRIAAAAGDQELPFPNGDLGSRKAYIWNKCMITVHHHSPKNAIMVDFWYETPVTLTYKKAISKRKQVFQNPDFL